MSSDETSSHIFQILSNYNLFLKTYENTEWRKKASPEIIKNAFKLAAFIERAMENLIAKGMFSQFLNLFRNWLWQNEKRQLTYQVDFFEYASDYVLEILLFNKAIPITSSAIALRIYTSLYSAERLENFFKPRILKYSSYDVLQTIIIESSCDPTDIEARVTLKDWDKLVNKGDIEIVKRNIKEMFSHYKLRNTLPVLLKMLIIPGGGSTITEIQSFIIEELQEKLADRTTLNKGFWNYVFKELNVSILTDVCSQYKIITDMLFNFIEYIGSMMNSVFVNSKKTWIADSDFSLCPEITYDDLFKVIKAFHGTSDIRNEVVSKISDAYKNSSSELWEDILFSL